MATPLSSAAAMTSSSRIEPPGWITAVAPASIAVSRPSGNGKKASDAKAEPMARGSRQSRGLGRLRGLGSRRCARVDAAHLARADAGGRSVLGIDDGVRLDVLGDAEGEQHVGDSCSLGARLVTIFSSHVVDDGIVARLHEEAAGDRAEHLARRAGIGQAAGRAAGAGSSWRRRSRRPLRRPRARSPPR